MASCSNCGMPGFAKGRCRNCYFYWRRNGRERPEEVRLRTARRTLEKELMARAWGPLIALANPSDVI